MPRRNLYAVITNVAVIFISFHILSAMPWQKRNELDRNVCVYTVNNESRYVVIDNIPSIGVIEELWNRFGIYGNICMKKILSVQERPDFNLSNVASDCQFIDAVWIKYEDVDSARHAKIRGKQKPFYGSILKIHYSPQCETGDDTAAKLKERREMIHRRGQYRLGNQYLQSEIQSLHNVRSESADIIGPRKRHSESEQVQYKVRRR